MTSILEILPSKSTSRYFVLLWQFEINGWFEVCHWLFHPLYHVISRDVITTWYEIMRAARWVQLSSWPWDDNVSGDIHSDLWNGCLPWIAWWRGFPISCGCKSFLDLWVVHSSVIILYMVAFNHWLFNWVQWPTPVVWSWITVPRTSMYLVCLCIWHVLYWLCCVTEGGSIQGLAKSFRTVLCSGEDPAF